MTAILQPKCRLSKLSQMHNHIRKLQKDNKDLQRSLKEQIVKLNQNFDNKPYLQNRLISSTLLLKQEHAEIRQKYSNVLLQTQIQLQEQTEMKQIIANYQKRIFELQCCLANKQLEIVQQNDDMEREGAAKRQNMQLLAKNSAQKVLIKKALAQMKKLKVEIEALQYSLSAKSNIDKNCTTIYASKSKNHTQNMAPNAKDKLLIKVCKILQIEMVKEDNLKAQINRLKMDLEHLSNEHRKFAKKYRKSREQKQRNLNKGVNFGQRRINFLDQLQMIEAKQQKQGIHFKRLDTNTIQLPKGKTEKKKTISREKHRINKQN